MNISVLSTLLAGANGASQRSSMSMIILIVAMFGVMYFVMIRPQKKKQQQEQEMRDSIQVGDEITTIGGIMGRVVTVKEDSLVIETGADRNKMKITRWAVSTNNTAVEKAEAEKAAAKEAAEAEKNKKIEEAAEAGKAKRKKTKKNKDDTF
ncbi:MAG: preprotein translocase subunit YajC, partial [Clostridia bacterium]|nr:preprotein translocase subunit YajC [Clostridia bacterium]